MKKLKIKVTIENAANIEKTIIDFAAYQKDSLYSCVANEILEQFEKQKIKHYKETSFELKIEQLSHIDFINKASNFRLNQIVDEEKERLANCYILEQCKRHEPPTPAHDFKGLDTFLNNIGYQKFIKI